MKYKLRSKEVIAITWNKEISQAQAMEQLKEIGCTDIEISNSGAGISICFKYDTPNSHKPVYFGCIFYNMVLVFEEVGKYPKTYSSKEFNELYERQD